MSPSHPSQTHRTLHVLAAAALTTIVSAGTLAPAVAQAKDLTPLNVS